MKTNYIQTSVSIDDVIDGSKFIIPQFQRSVVWDHKRRTAFLKNVRAGEPIGIILIRNDNGRYQLIDGLQRISTLKDFYKNKFSYLEPSDIDMSLINKLITKHLELMNLPVTQQYIDSVNKSYRDKFFECLKGGLKNYEIMTAMRNEFGLMDANAINDIINDIYDAFMKSINLDGLNIMAINYTGPVENIPDVFFNLNTGGVQLSKYETYAALWSRTLFKVQDDEIIDVVLDKYTQLQADSDMEVDYDEDSLKHDGITLFEYCYALSGILHNKRNEFNIIMGESNESTDPTGFELLALLLAGGVNKAGLLYSKLKDVSPAFLVRLKQVIQDSMKAVTKALKGMLLDQNGNSLCSDSSYLIYHILASYILEYYDINVNAQDINARASSLKKSDFQKYMPYHYLYACMTEFWRNNRQVSDLNREINNEESRRRYWYKISNENWTSAIHEFMEAQEGSGKKIIQKNKLFLNVLIKLKLKEFPQYHQYLTPVGNGFNTEPYIFDVEHIVPKKVISNHIKDLPASRQKVFPYSPVGNLCYLTCKDNRSKKDKTLFEYTSDRPSYVTDTLYLGFIDYPDQNKLSFLNYNNADFRDAYDKFFKERQKLLEQEFLKLVQKEM